VNDGIFERLCPLHQVLDFAPFTIERRSPAALRLLAVVEVLGLRLDVVLARRGRPHVNLIGPAVRYRIGRHLSTPAFCLLERVEFIANQLRKWADKGATKLGAEAHAQLPDPLWWTPLHTCVIGSRTNWFPEKYVGGSSAMLPHCESRYFTAA
jgi:hypothetical protein